MKKKLFTPVFLIFALIVSACSGILPEPINIPPAQAVQACSVGNPDAVIVGGKKYDCSDVANAMATLGAPSGPAATSAPAPSGSMVSLNYDETNSDPLTAGQAQLIAKYLRLTAPISQSALESAVVKIQQEAAAAQATVFEGQTLALDQRQAWLVWCSDATAVDPPADVSLVHEITLLASDTVGRTWIQVPFAEGVPLRTDDTWTGCPDKFWAVAVH